MDIPTGFCMDMCPHTEIVMRERENLLHFFEIEPGTERNKRPKALRNCVVKEYTRPAAGKEDAKPHDLRPPHVLNKTLHYLITRILPRTDRSWSFVYDFVFDRLRAMRKDMVIQRISGNAATKLLESIVRFHIYSSYRLCDEPISVFDPKINDTHTQECLKRLLVLYNGDEDTRENMGELLAVYILYNLGRIEALQHAIACKHLLRADANFLKALDASLSFMSGNYVRVLRIVRHMEPIFLCAIHSHIGKIQSFALVVMSAGYHSKSLRFNWFDLIKVLAFDDINEAKLVCKVRSLDVNDSGVVFNNSAFTDVEKVSIKPCAFIESSLRHVHLSSLILGDASEK